MLHQTTPEITAGFQLSKHKAGGGSVCLGASSSHPFSQAAFCSVSRAAPSQQEGKSVLPQELTHHRSRQPSKESLIPLLAQ